MPAKPPPIGERFGRLTVIRSVRRLDKSGGRYDWECRCDCGEVVIAQQRSVRTGHTRSCGCLNREIVGGRHRRHGMSHLPYYLNWQSMIQRCENPKVPHYARYGGRGIRVCDRWKVFENFRDDVGDRPSTEHSLDRWPDNDGNYEPGNVRWANRREQLLNTRRSIAKRAKQARKTMTLDPISTRRFLINRRGQLGAETPAGYRCSNIVEQVENYARATGAQKLKLEPMIERQLKDLEKLTGTHN